MPQKKKQHARNKAVAKKEYNRQIANIESTSSQPQQPFKKIQNNRGRMLVKQDTEEQKKARIQECYEIITPRHNDVLEVSYEEIHIGETLIEIPLRPPWNYSDSKEELEEREKKYIETYLQELEKKFPDLGYYELNIEIWRQLWRVVERSDVLLFIIDIRFPIQTFNPSLYNYVTQNLKKHMIVVFNKLDLVPASVVVAWKEYFLEKFPDLHIICLASRPASFKDRNKKNIKMATEGAQQIYEICQKLMKDKIDISSWKEKIEADASTQRSEYEIDVPDEDEEEETKPKRLTLGCVGAPNVGKSTLINALKGKTVVRARNRPGITKHLQTIFICHNVILCDCPGLLFPSLVSKSLQVIMGSYGVANVKVPMHPVIFLAQHFDLVKLLALKNFDEDLAASTICEAWAIKHSFKTAKSGQPDSNRAANHLLRKCLEGNLVPIFYYPPNFFPNKEHWYNHPELDWIKLLQQPRQT